MAPVQETKWIDIVAAIQIFAGFLHKNQFCMDKSTYFYLPVEFYPMPSFWTDELMKLKHL